MRVRLLAVGRVRDPSLRRACDGYASRIGRYLRFVADEARDAGRQDADADAARRSEARTLLRSIGSSDIVVALTRVGEAVTSEGLAQRLEGWQVAARDVSFVLGGAHGLADPVLERADVRLSLSAFTLPHELARLVLLEQLYRACTILRGEPYHKGRGR
jgi:23S rRNA (pseudouridine1915-N3)-methyltransferase